LQKEIALAQENNRLILPEMCFHAHMDCVKRLTARRISRLTPCNGVKSASFAAPARPAVKPPAKDKTRRNRGHASAGALFVL
jgi:hypothetical protein